MFMHYWLALFTTAFCANMIGLNISAAFNSAITIYIVIPLLIIPMMVLSGAMFSFDKLNRTIGNVDKVPLIAELMPTRWTYEALMVAQFKDNRFSRVQYSEDGETYYILQKKISEADFNKVHRIPELKRALETTLFEYNNNPRAIASNSEILAKNPPRQFSRLLLLKNELTRLTGLYNIPVFRYIEYLTPYEFNPVIADSVSAYLTQLERIFSQVSNTSSDKKDRFYRANNARLKQLQSNYFNFKLEEIVTKYYERKKILVNKNSIIQNVDPVYLDPYQKGFPGFRTHFFAPSKIFFGTRIDTFYFNIILVISNSLLLYLALYYEIFARIVRFLEKFKFRKQHL
jgi:hypothetical protein